MPAVEVPLARPLVTRLVAIETAPLAIEDGHARIPDRPGTGVDWDEDAAARCRLVD